MALLVFINMRAYGLDSYWTTRASRAIHKVKRTTPPYVVKQVAAREEQPSLHVDDFHEPPTRLHVCRKACERRFTGNHPRSHSLLRQHRARPTHQAPPGRTRYFSHGPPAVPLALIDVALRAVQPKQSKKRGIPIGKTRVMMTA